VVLYCLAMLTKGARKADKAPAIASPMFAATIAACALIAQHVIAKATRDALFLSSFSAARLPLAMTVSTVFSGGIVILFGKIMSRFGPARVVPRLFALHAGLLAFDWILAQRFERVAAIAVYLHTASLGATILSAFWSVVSEAFDPHAGKQAIGRIAGGAALGGAVGGGMAWGGSRMLPVPAMLLVGAALSLLSMWGVNLLARQAHPPHQAPSADVPRPSGFAVLRDTPYLRLLGALVVVGALSQALLDYALGVQAKAMYGGGARLLGFFALFQAGIGLASFLLQTTANRRSLSVLGIGGTIALMPAAVAGAATFALAMPSLITAALQRGAEGVLRASLFRSAYEVLFTPLPQSLKRPTKTYIDVTLERAGGLVGGGVTVALIALWPHGSFRAVTIAVVVVTAVQLALAYRLHRGYVATLAEQLRSGAVQLDFASVFDATTRNTLSRTLSNIDRSTLLAKINQAWMEKHPTVADRPSLEPVATPVDPPPRPASVPTDDIVHTMAQLRSNDTATTRAGLRSDGVSSHLLAPQLIELLSREDVARDAMRSLAPRASEIAGTILDAVLDERRETRLRRRAARLLRDVPSQRVADGLALGLSVEAFDVRYVCGRVLVRLRGQNAGLRFDASGMFDRAKRQLETASQDPRSLEHAFDMLSLAGPHEPIQLAYGALQGTDVFLCGVAFEYLDVVLPVDVRAAMTFHLSKHPPGAAAARTSDRSLDDLLKSKEKINHQLDELRRSRDPDSEPSA
jgi:ATP:ADP antiporter, AAA family